MMKPKLHVFTCVASILVFSAPAVLAQTTIEATKWDKAGDAARNAKDYTTAITDYQRAISFDSTYASAWFHLGYAYLNQQQFQQAAGAFKRYLALPAKPDEQVAWLLLGVTYQDLKQYSDAAEAFRTLIRLTNERGMSYKAHYELGHSLSLGGQYAAAIDELRQAFQLEERACDAVGACADSESLRSYLGLSFYQLNRYPEALQAFQEAARLKPDDSDNNYFLGMTYVRMGRRTEAMAQYQILLRAGSREAADLYARIQNIGTEAVRAQSGSPKPLSPAPAAEDSKVYAEQCKKRVDAQEYAEAVDVCKKAVVAAPFAAGLWSSLGMAYFGTKRYTEAAQAYEQVTRVSPNDAHAWYGIGAAYVETKQFDKAVPPLREAVRLDAGNASEWYDLGHSFYEVSQYANAAEALERAARLQPNDSATDYWLGRTYVKLGRRAQAQEAYDRLVGPDKNRYPKLSLQLSSEINGMRT